MTLLQRSNFLNSDIRLALADLAGRFSFDEVVKKRIAERTLNIVCDNPELLDSHPIKVALFRAMYEVAREEIGMRAERSAFSPAPLGR